MINPASIAILNKDNFYKTRSEFSKYNKLKFTIYTLITILNGNTIDLVITGLFESGFSGSRARYLLLSQARSTCNHY